MGDANIILRPMKALFSTPYGKTDDEMIIMLREYHSALSKFDNVVLQEAWEKIKITATKFPTLAECIDTCNKTHVISPQKPLQRDLSEHDILTSKEGQKALNANQGRNYLINCMRENKILPADKIIRANQKKDYSIFHGAHLERMKKFDAEMQEKEKRLRAKYLTRN